MKHIKNTNENRNKHTKKNINNDETDIKSEGETATQKKQTCKELSIVDRNITKDIQEKSTKLPKELRLNTLKNCHLSLNRIIRSYWADEIAPAKARNMAYLLRIKFDAISMTARLTFRDELEQIKKELEESGRLKKVNDDEEM
ncbi:MAG: hypothetical protein A2001_13885 [Treponema sp. GWC1_61_84]|nr:MAG: hypothetical protein A2001_13885 [Treponema sp. GWC1_61_84]